MKLDLVVNSHLNEDIYMFSILLKWRVNCNGRKLRFSREISTFKNKNKKISKHRWPNKAELKHGRGGEGC